jgi:hypothetical protein
MLMAGREPVTAKARRTTEQYEFWFHLRRIGFLGDLCALAVITVLVPDCPGLG